MRLRMKPMGLEAPTKSDDPEIVVDGSQSMMEPISSRGDPPEPTLSLSPKSSRSGKDVKKHKSRKRQEDSAHRSPRTPRSLSSSQARSPPRSPRVSDLYSDVSREPPEQVGGSLSETLDERIFVPTLKGVEPPDNTLVTPAMPYYMTLQDAPSGDKPTQDEDSVQLEVPHEFKKTKSVKSMKSNKSATGSRRSSSRRRKAQKVETVDCSHTLQGVFNGHLMKYRFDAEEAGPFVRIPAFFGSTGLILTTTYALIFDPNTWTILSIVLALFIYAIALLSVILEGRFMCSNPLGIRAHLRSALTRRNRVFRFVWGRGLLYVVAGLLSCVLLLIPTIVTGIFMVTVGVVAVVSGAYASRMFYLLRDSLKDDDYLAKAFNKYDSDKDGFITLPEFVCLLSTLGLDVDDRIGIKAFHAADVGREYKISLEAFQTWWKGAFLKNGKVPKLDDMESELGSDEEEGSYQRMS